MLRRFTMHFSIDKVVFSLLLCGVWCCKQQRTDLEYVYECKNPDYTFTRLLQSCRDKFYVRHLADVRKKLDREMDGISGDFLAEVLRHNCKTVPLVDSCMEEEMSYAGCSISAQHQYYKDIDKTNWICRDGAMEDFIKVLKSLPLVSLKSDNNCYQESVKRSYFCIQTFLYTQPTTMRGVMHRTLRSIPCTYFKLRQICSKEQSFLLTFVSYELFLMPPVLGVNVTDALKALIRDVSEM